MSPKVKEASISDYENEYEVILNQYQRYHLFVIIMKMLKIIMIVIIYLTIIIMKMLKMVNQSINHLFAKATP